MMPQSDTTKLCIYLHIICQFLDLVTTIWIVLIVGVQAEGNPFVRTMLEYFGIYSLVICKFLIIFYLLFLIKRNSSKIFSLCLYGLTVIYIGVVISNMSILLQLYANT